MRGFRVIGHAAAWRIPPPLQTPAAPPARLCQGAEPDARARQSPSGSSWASATSFRALRLVLIWNANASTVKWLCSAAQASVSLWLASGPASAVRHAAAIAADDARFWGNVARNSGRWRCNGGIHASEVMIDLRRQGGRDWPPSGRSPDSNQS